MEEVPSPISFKVEVSVGELLHYDWHAMPCCMACLYQSQMVSGRQFLGNISPVNDIFLFSIESKYKSFYSKLSTPTPKYRPS